MGASFNKYEIAPDLVLFESEFKGSVIKEILIDNGKQYRTLRGNNWNQNLGGFIKVHYLEQKLRRYFFK